MKLSIRLQNHGKINHPLWWIVVAPNRKNIKGRFIQKLGLWSPRHGLNIQRQIVMNIPRIKFWMSRGAVPTYKIHNYLSLWDILPKQWYYKKSQEELAKLIKPEEELTDKQKRKKIQKQKKRQKQQLSQLNYYKYESKSKNLSQFNRKIQSSLNMQEEQNQILRDILIRNQFEKISRINELSNGAPLRNRQQVQKLTKKLTQAKNQLSYLQKNFKQTHPLQQIKMIQIINSVSKQISKLKKKYPTMNWNKNNNDQQSQYMTQDLLKNQIAYELVYKKLQKLERDLNDFERMDQPVSVQEYAEYLMRMDNKPKLKAIKQAQAQFLQRGISGQPMRKYEFMLFNEDKKIEKLEEELNMKDADTMTIMKKLVLTEGFILPCDKPVHPYPDLNTYIPEEYYEPVNNQDLQLINWDSLQPHEEVEKYHRKKKQTQNQ